MCAQCILGLGIGKDLMVQCASRYMDHNVVVLQYIVPIATYWDISHSSLKSRADKEVVVYNLVSLNTSHYIDYSADKLSQNSYIQNFLSGFFGRY